MYYIPKYTKKNILDARNILSRLVSKASSSGVTNAEYDLMIVNSKYISDQLESNKYEHKTIN